MIFVENNRQINKFYLESHTFGSYFSTLVDNISTFVC